MDNEVACLSAAWDALLPALVREAACAHIAGEINSAIDMLVRLRRGIEDEAEV